MTMTNSTNRNTFLAVAVGVRILTVQSLNAPVAMPAVIRDSARAATISETLAIAVKIAVSTSAENTVLKSAEVATPVISAKDSMSQANRVKQDVAADLAKKVADAAAAEAAEEDS